MKRFPRAWMTLAVLAAVASVGRGQSRPVSDEELLRPTQRGLRMNPVMARSFMRLWVGNDDIWKDLNLSPEQQRQVADALARRTMNMARNSGPEIRDGMEFLFESMIVSEGNIEKLGPQRSRELGEKLLPVARMGREWLGGVVDDARPFLTDQQLKMLEEEVSWAGRKAENFEKRLNQWAQGQYQENDNPFDELESNEGRPDRARQSEPIRNARRMAEWDMRRLSDWEWSRLFAGLAVLFKFDPQQRARGQAILDAYRRKADAIMTPEWRERVLLNRMLYNTRWQLGNDVPKGPWQHQLEREYKEATRPITDLTDGLVRELLALVTPEQRAAAVESIRAVAEKHGLVLEDADLALLWLTPPPATAPVEGEHAGQ
ncbi:MAG: hypothetical protein HRF43_19130 [Phycisphaerae bacterium]